MIHYYTNREVAEKLEINLARWKRWSRSFLPPDPLGGMQSGYARQYAFKDVFKVYLGGHLLSHLKLSVPDSLQVINDLSPWIKKNGFSDFNGANGAVPEISGQSNGYRIYFCPVKDAVAKTGSRFCYLIRKTVDTQSNRLATGLKIMETVEETTIRIDAADGCFFLKDPHVRMINFSPLFAALVKKLHLHPH